MLHVPSSAASLSSRCSTSSASAALYRPLARPSARCARSRAVAVRAHKIELQHDGGVAVLDVPEGGNILEAALEAGVDVPHSCKLGVCMNCASRLLTGEVEPGAGMLREELQQEYALLCVSQPLTDCTFKVIPEEELREKVMEG